MAIIPISSNTKENACDTLYLSFKNDPLTLWMFDDIENYAHKAPLVIKSWIRWTEFYGIAIATSQLESVALWKKPNKHTFTFGIYGAQVC